MFMPVLGCLEPQVLEVYFFRGLIYIARQVHPFRLILYCYYCYSRSQPAGLREIAGVRDPVFGCPILWLFLGLADGHSCRGRTERPCHRLSIPSTMPQVLMAVIQLPQDRTTPQGNTKGACTELLAVDQGSGSVDLAVGSTLFYSEEVPFCLLYYYYSI